MEYRVSALLALTSSECRKGGVSDLWTGRGSKGRKRSQEQNGLWRLHRAFHLPAERFSFIESDDEKGGERLDRVSFAKAKSPSPIVGLTIPILRRIFSGKTPMPRRAGWKGRAGAARRENLSISWPLSRRRRASVISIRRSGSAAKKRRRWSFGLSRFASPRRRGGRAREGAGRRKARRLCDIRRHADSSRMGHSFNFVDGKAFAAAEIGQLYRARWRIELAFKRLKKSLVCQRREAKTEMAKTWILAHILMALLLEPHTSAPEISPRMPAELRRPVRRLTSLAANACSPPHAGAMPKATSQLSDATCSNHPENEVIKPSQP